MKSSMQLQILLLCFLLSSTTFCFAQLDASETVSEGKRGGGADTDPGSAPRLTVGSFFPERPIIIARRRLSVPFSPGKEVKLTCRVSDGGQFVGWVKSNQVVGNELQLTVELNDDAYGAYLCIAANPTDFQKSAMEFVVAEMPVESDNAAVIPLKINAKAAMRCRMNSASGYDWFRYNDVTYRFVKINGKNDRTLKIPYDYLVRGNDPGFTFYKCQSKDLLTSSSMELFSLKKEPLLETVGGTSRFRYEISMRPVDSSVAAVPVQVVPQSRVSLECHKPSASDVAEWSFRSNATVDPRTFENLVDSSVDVKEDSDVSVLSVKNYGMSNVGYYRCNVGSTVKYAFVDLEVIAPTIHEFSKSVYNMDDITGEKNELECEIPIGGRVSDVVWRVVPPSDRGASFDIGINQRNKGFKTVANLSAGSRLVLIKFKNSGLLNAYRLECRLEDAFDFVTLKTDLPNEGLMNLYEE